MNKKIEVVAAVILHEGRIFATQRGYGEWKDWWEFPGGKMEAGETPEEALSGRINSLLKESGTSYLLINWKNGQKNINTYWKNGQKSLSLHWIIGQRYA